MFQTKLSNFPLTMNYIHTKANWIKWTILPRKQSVIDMCEILDEFLLCVSFSRPHTWCDLVSNGSTKHQMTINLWWICFKWNQTIERDSETQLEMDLDHLLLQRVKIANLIAELFTFYIWLPLWCFNGLMTTIASDLHLRLITIQFIIVRRNCGRKLLKW